MAQVFLATVYGQNGNDLNKPSGVVMGFSTQNVILETITPTAYSGVTCNTAIKVLPTAPSPIQPVYYTPSTVTALKDLANA